ncbi:MAG TPA: glycosyltransferase family 2 protein [Pirellulaceae bacterium]|nr:glycosyltransferase family 2 protein [Pirellulaceae bacterium]
MVISSTHLPAAPRVSIGLPVFNAQKFLPTALDALLAQTYGDFELIVSDNASTDETLTICRDYAATDRRICIHRATENRGAAWNFNRVAELATGTYFKWAASDDICEPTFVERCVEVLEADRSVVCCHARTCKIDVGGEVLHALRDPTTVSTQYAGAERASRRFGNVLLNSGWAARSYGVIRREQLGQTSLIQPYYGSEKVLMAELALRGRFYDLPEVLFRQRVHSEASSNLGSVRQQQYFFSPRLASRRTSPRLRLLQGYVRAVHRAPLSFDERVRCWFWMGRYLLQFRKWNSVIQSARQGTGNGAAGRELLRTHASGNSR